MIKLKSLGGATWIRNRGLSYAVSNPFDCNDFSHLIGHVVTLDDEPAYVLGVERRAHAPPWITGEPICILVAEDQSGLA